MKNIIIRLIIKSNEWFEGLNDMVKLLLLLILIAIIMLSFGTVPYLISACVFILWRSSYYLIRPKIQKQ